MNFASFDFNYDPLRSKGIKDKAWKEVKDWALSLVYVAVVYLTCTTIWAEGYLIPSGSMEPTFHGDPNLFKGDRIFALKWIACQTPFKRGDIVIFVSVEDQETFIVKRLVGLPGDTVEIKNSQVWINGAPLVDPPVFKNITYYQAHIGSIKTTFSEQRLENPVQGFGTQPYTVPKDCFFVMGDNSSSSNDGRYWGPLPMRNVMGKARLIWWPPKRIKIIE